MDCRRVGTHITLVTVASVELLMASLLDPLGFSAVATKLYYSMNLAGSGFSLMGMMPHWCYFKNPAAALPCRDLALCCD
eukprot:3757553-Amphidinium_carterae.1